MGKVKEFLKEKLNPKMKIKTYTTENPKWVVIKAIKPSPKTKKSLNLPENFKYFIMLDVQTGRLKCDCMGYIAHKKCKHTEYFRSFINQLKNENGFGQ